MEDLGLSKQVEEIRISNNIDYTKYAKSTLPAVTISGLFGERKSNGIIQHSGFICIDIDGKDNPHIDNFEILKERLSSSKYIQYAGLSVGGHGLFCLVKISNPQKHKEHFNSLLDYFSEMKIVIDKACSDVTRLRIYSSDENPYINEKAEVYAGTGTVSNTSGSYTTIKTSNITQEMTNEYIVSERYVDVKKYTKETQVLKILEQIEAKQIDITQDYHDWINLCIAIAFRYREKGRDIFHDICKYYPRYSFDECNVKYTSILNSGYTKSIATLFECAKKSGIQLNDCL